MAKNFASARKYLPYAALAALAFICYGLYLNPHFATDTYTDLPNLEDVTRGALNNGRFVNLAFVLLMRLLGINYVASPAAQVCVNFLAICCAAAACFLLFRLLEKRFGPFSAVKKITAVLACAVIFCNPFFCDMFQFTECIFGFMLGLPLAVKAAGTMSDYEAPFLKRLYTSAILIVVVAGCYQPYLNYFMIAYLVLFMGGFSKNAPRFRFVRELAGGVCVYAVGALSGFVMLRIMNPGANRVMQNLDLADNIKQIANLQKPLLLESYGLIPGFVFLAALLAALIYCAVSAGRKASPSAVICLCLAVLGVYLVNFTLFLPTSKGQFWPSPRTLTSFMGLPGAVALLGGALSSGRPERAVFKAARLLASAGLAVLLCFYLVSSVNIAGDLLYTNKKDREEVEFYAEKIREYEQSAGIQVTKAAFAYDSYPKAYHDGVIHSHDMNMRAFYRSWARKPFLSFVTGKDLAEVAMPEAVSFGGKNWDALSQEQIVFHGDTVCIAVY